MGRGASPPPLGGRDDPVVVKAYSLTAARGTFVDPTPTLSSAVGGLHHEKKKKKRRALCSRRDERKVGRGQRGSLRGNVDRLERTRAPVSEE